MTTEFAKNSKLFLDCTVSARRSKLDQKAMRCPHATLYAVRLTSLTCNADDKYPTLNGDVIEKMTKFEECIKLSLQD